MHNEVQYTTMRRVAVTVVALQKQEILHILSVCAAHVMYMLHIVICSLSGCTIFSKLSFG
jgi:hypothetical protein